MDRRFNAANFFTNATPGNHKPRSTVNHFGGSLGGPILRNKLFFFFDGEWVRIALPIVSATTVPTPAFQNYVLQQLPLGGTDSVTGSIYQPAPQLVPFYQKMFSLYGNTAGRRWRFWDVRSTATEARRRAILPTGMVAPTGRAFRIPATIASRSQTARIDYNINENEHNVVPVSGGHRPAGRLHRPDQLPCSMRFRRSRSTHSPSGYTHVFSHEPGELFQPRVLLVRESCSDRPIFSRRWRRSPSCCKAAAPMRRSRTLGGLDNTWVQGRRASRFFINDNLAWSHRRPRISVWNQHQNLPAERL